MNLGELAFACYIYASMSDFDNSYRSFQGRINDDLDLTSADHRQALITWLNKWGCRQFSVECHDQASGEILQWYEDYRDILPVKDTDLYSMLPEELELTSRAYENLMGKIASHRAKGSGRIPVSIGATGAAKILFALRPKALVLWDEPIRAKLKYDASGQSYYRFHMDMKRALSQLESQCKVQGISLYDLPRYLDRPHSSIPKLIDEFNWVTITKNCRCPGAAILSRWTTWNRT
ncbi:MAG: hypothetical protein C0390_00055 [Syntrophus sp. (in: bacteria)]|nr:hypothetical protein [Syntrophus sp. (in: bacteria)]